MFSSLLQWNCQGLRAKYEELKLLISEFSPVLICVQETMLGVNTPCPRDYTSFRTAHIPAIGSHGGCLIYVRHDVPSLPLRLTTPLDAVAVQVDLGRKYSVCSLYLPPVSPNTHISQNDLADLLDQLPRPFLLLGDLNGRHSLWGDVISNTRGNLLASWIEHGDVGLLNTGEPTHFHSQTGSFSSIDLSICSSDCLIDFNWRVCDDLHSSDHFPLILESACGLLLQRPS